MAKEVPLGIRGEAESTVEHQHTLNHHNKSLPAIFSTPHMIGLMEWTCRNTVLPYLEPGHDTVGTQVNVTHLAAAPIGMVVTCTAEITGVNEKRVTFRVEARDEKEKIGEGTHERAIINVAKFATRMAAKKA